jgi:hypothetical protein
MASPIQPEEHRVPGDQLLSRAKEFLHEGNVRRLIVKNEQGHTIIEVPLTMGVVGALLAPTLAAIGAIAAVAGHYTLVVERRTAPGAPVPPVAIAGDSTPPADLPR